MRVLIDAETIQTKIRTLSKEIAHDYKGTGNLVLVGVFEGARVFFNALGGYLEIPFLTGHLSLSSYPNGVDAADEVLCMADLSCDIRNQHVLVIEDIVDTGRTMQFVTEYLTARQPASVKCCTLLNKPSRRKVACHLDYVGFDVPDVFVVGFGMDLAGTYRDLPDISIIPPQGTLIKNGDSPAGLPPKK